MIRRFNPPPGWNVPPHPWTPPRGWKPDPAWPSPPVGWVYFIEVPDEEVELEAPIQAIPSCAVNLDELRAKIEIELRSRLINLNDELVIQEAGLYEYHHPLENALAYREELAAISSRVKAIIKAKRAILTQAAFTYDNSPVKGAQMMNDLANLALNAFNQEVENAVRAMRAGALATAEKRVRSSAEKIERFGKMMQIRVSDEYLSLRLRELELSADYLAKLAEEKMLAREEKVRLREEEIARKELEAQGAKLKKEREHYLNAVSALHQQDEAADLTAFKVKIEELDKAIAENDFRINNVRAGYVYVISNAGAFGPGVVKIGMTRRLEPIDRINELGDASVPFRFSVHALFFSDDAVGLESKLHDKFSNRRLNIVNPRREFFFATPSEIREELQQAIGALLEFDEHTISEEYLQSRGTWPQAR